MDKLFIVSTERIGELAAFLEESGNEVLFAERRNVPESDLYRVIRRGHEGVLTFMQVETESHVMLENVLPGMFQETWIYPPELYRLLDTCLYGPHNMSDEAALVAALEALDAVPAG